jgi:Zn-dependent protease
MNISELIIFLPVVLFSLTIHEYAHGWVAYKCGDDTARSMGRLTLDPFKHLDPLGTIMMIGTYLTDFIPFGWAKPVPIDPRFFHNPKRDIIVNVSLAIFNLLPFAPLDGSKIIIGFLPDNKIASYLHYSQYAGIAFIFLLIAESVLKVKTISYILGPMFSYFFVFVNQIFMVK